MKNVLLVPIAGYGQRFKSAGYPKPKQQLMLDGLTSCLLESLNSVELDEFRVIFILRRFQIDHEGFSEFLATLDFQYELVVLDAPTRGSVETCLAAEHLLRGDERLHIFTMDVSFEPKLTSETFPADVDGGVLTFKSNSPNYSYVIVEDGSVKSAAEKLPISDDAVVGVYFYAQSSEFFRHAKDMIAADETTRGEFYLSPMFNRMIQGGSSICAIRTTSFFVFGTPAEFEFHKKFGRRSLANEHLRIGLASDHSGFELKKQLSGTLSRLGVTHDDFGTYSSRATDYSDHVGAAVDALHRGEVDYVFASCRSGQGALISGSAHDGILGNLVFDIEAGMYGVRHNAANLFSFPERIWLNNEDLGTAVEAILRARFEGGRHQTRLMKVLEQVKGVGNA